MDEYTFQRVAGCLLDSHFRALPSTWRDVYRNLEAHGYAVNMNLTDTGAAAIMGMANAAFKDSLRNELASTRGALLSANARALAAHL